MTAKVAVERVIGDGGHKLAVGRTLEPVRVVVGAAFAPAQGAIGGSNLYLDARPFPARRSRSTVGTGIRAGRRLALPFIGPAGLVWETRLVAKAGFETR